MTELQEAFQYGMKTDFSDYISGIYYYIRRNLSLNESINSPENKFQGILLIKKRKKIITVCLTEVI